MADSGYQGRLPQQVRSKLGLEAVQDLDRLGNGEHSQGMACAQARRAEVHYSKDRG